MTWNIELKILALDAGLCEVLKDPSTTKLITHTHTHTLKDSNRASFSLSWAAPSRHQTQGQHEERYFCSVRKESEPMKWFDSMKITCWNEWQQRREAMKERPKMIQCIIAFNLILPLPSSLSTAANRVNATLLFALSLHLAS